MKYIKIFESYFGTIGAGIVSFCCTTKRFLIGYRSQHVLDAHTWGGFGGLLDYDEDVKEIEKAAKRELEEETKYFNKIELLKGFIFKDKNSEYHNFIGVVDDEFKPILNYENDKAVWMTYQELLKLPNKHFGLKIFLKESKNLFESINVVKYIFHGTHTGACITIQRDGKMKLFENPYISFTSHLNVAQGYAERKGGTYRCQVLRTLKTDDFKLSQKFNTNNGYEWETPNEIPIDRLEVKTDSGWVPLSRWDFVDKTFK